MSPVWLSTPSAFFISSILILNLSFKPLVKTDPTRPAPPVINIFFIEIPSELIYFLTIVYKKRLNYENIKSRNKVI